MVAAAFIGPGTVTACTLAGANFGHALLWTLLFATLATILLQEMSARLGIVTGQGLGDALREAFSGTPAKWPLVALVLVAIFIGNCAYEAGNISGAALGLQAVLGESPALNKAAVLGLSALAAGLLWLGSYRHLERALVGLVAVMALAFVATFIAVRPDLGAMLRGLLTPSLPDGSLLTAIALIGTTIVPYNLFLHASASKKKWAGAEGLAATRTDTAVSIGLGGLITTFIIGTAATTLFGSGLSVSGAGDMAVQLEPVFGSGARYMLGIGLLAAGLSSSLTAPLATAYAVTEILGLRKSETDRSFKAVALTVLFVGTALSLTGIQPITIILSAQFANGLLLPIVAAFLLFAMNRKSRLGRYVNGWKGNLAGALVVLVTAGLGARLILRALGVL